MSPTFVQQMDLPVNCHNWQRVAGEAGRANLQRLAPERTGYLASQATYTESLSTSLVRFTANPEGAKAPYDYFQEVGTGLYGPLRRWITPKRAKFLSWVNEDGDRIFARRVRGVKPQRFFYGAMVAVFGPERVRYYGASGPREPGPI